MLVPVADTTTTKQAYVYDKMAYKWQPLQLHKSITAVLSDVNISWLYHPEKMKTVFHGKQVCIR